ncbi:MAG: type I-MYXAN CRISPR-associated protein Cas6/Cmx6 [Gammaproteobacteria bacterium]
MYWQENEDDPGSFQLSKDVVDLVFAIQCRTLPLDHGNALYRALIRHLPWLKDEPSAAIHQIHVAESSHGWNRPQDPSSELLWPSRRTRLVLRVPQHRVEDSHSLVDRTLDIDGHELTIGPAKQKMLSKLTTIFARYVDTGGTDQDQEFIQNMADILQQRKIHTKKMMSGLLVKHRTKDGYLLTRKLMLAGLSIEDSVRLQQQGIGDRQLMGIGIFLPHKGIDSVRPA